MDRYLGSTHAPITCFIPTDYRKNNDPPIKMGFLIKEIGYLRRLIVSVAVYLSEWISKGEQAKVDCAAWEQWAEEACVYVEGYKARVKEQIQAAHALWRTRDEELAYLQEKLREVQLVVDEQAHEAVEKEEKLKILRDKLTDAKMEIFWLESERAGTNPVTCRTS